MYCLLIRDSPAQQITVLFLCTALIYSQTLSMSLSTTGSISFIFHSIYSFMLMGKSSLHTDGV